MIYCIAGVTTKSINKNGAIVCNGKGVVVEYGVVEPHNTLILFD